MEAIVTIAGAQFRVKKDDTIVVPKLAGDINSTLEFGGAIGISSNGLNLGGATVTVKVLEHGRDETVLIFHKKRSKGYQKLNGHRQQYTRIQITGVA